MRGPARVIQEDGLNNGPEAPGAAARAARVPLLTHSQARGMAESMWGRGGTTAYRSNRTGAFYFSCAGHGGFVIDDRALNDPERDLLAEAGFTADRCWGARDATGRILTIRHPDSQAARPRNVTYRPGRGEYVDRAIPVWTFEEDVEWAAVYALTGIRTPKAFGLSEAEMITYARESLARWYPKAAEVATRVAQGNGGLATQAAQLGFPASSPLTVPGRPADASRRRPAAKGDAARPGNFPRA
jgi:hypothetical protein